MFQEDKQLSQSLSQVYQLKAGDSLSKLAYEKLGDPSNWRELADLNNLDIFKALPVGQPINIPTTEQLREMVIAAAQTQVTNAVNDLTKDLDLSGLKVANPFGSLEHQLIEWVVGS
jgi:LysM repeat protein